MTNKREVEIHQRIKDKPVNPLCAIYILYTSDQPFNQPELTNPPAYQPTNRLTNRSTDKWTDRSSDIVGSLAFMCKIRARSNTCILYKPVSASCLPLSKERERGRGRESRRVGERQRVIICFIIVVSHPKSSAAARKGVANRGMPHRPACYQRHSGLGSCATSRGALT